MDSTNTKYLFEFETYYPFYLNDFSCWLVVCLMFSFSSQMSWILAKTSVSFPSVNLTSAGLEALVFVVELVYEVG